MSNLDLPHDWQIYDLKHQSCRRCGLRIFWTSGAYGAVGWVTLTGDGVMLTTRGADAAPPCHRPRNVSVELIIIEYTGDPDKHPGCERFMHRLADEELERTGRPSLGNMLPRCGWQARFWEIGPARIHPGWTVCGDCWPGKGPRSRECHAGRRQWAQGWDPGEMRPQGPVPVDEWESRRLPPARKPKALPPAAPKALPPAPKKKRGKK